MLNHKSIPSIYVHIFHESEIVSWNPLTHKMHTCMLTFMHLFRPLRYLSRWTDNGTLSLNADVGECLAHAFIPCAIAGISTMRWNLSSPPNGAELSKLPIKVYFCYEFSAIWRKLFYMFMINRYNCYCKRFLM